MAAVAELIKPRTREERIRAQRGAYVVRLAGGLYQALYGDAFPINPLNGHLRKLHRKGRAATYLKNIAYNTVRWIRNAGEADIDWLAMPEIAFETYWKVRIDAGLDIEAARAELSRVHSVFAYARDEAVIDYIPYPTKLVEPSARQRGAILRRQAFGSRRRSPSLPPTDPHG